MEVNFPTQQTVGKLGKKLGKRLSLRHVFKAYEVKVSRS